MRSSFAYNIRVLEFPMRKNLLFLFAGHANFFTKHMRDTVHEFCEILALDIRKLELFLVIFSNKLFVQLALDIRKFELFLVIFSHIFFLQLALDIRIFALFLLIKVYKIF